MSLRRIQSELLDFGRDPPDCASAGPINKDDLLSWGGFIKDLKGTPYEGGVFKLSIQFPQGYPFKPPEIKFLTKIYHPNITAEGYISLDLFKENWSPAMTISKALLTLVSYIISPAPENACVPEIASLYQTDRAKFEENAREWTQMYAVKSKNKNESL